MRMKYCVCRFCGKVFKHYTKISVCPECRTKDDEEFRKVYDYLKEYPNSNAMQIAEGLGISTIDVIRYIDEGRLVPNNGVFKSLD